MTTTIGPPLWRPIKFEEMVYPNDCHLCGPRLADQDGDCPNPNCPLKSTPVAEE